METKILIFAPVSEPERIPVFPKWLPHLETNAWTSGASHLTRPGLRVLPKSRELLSPRSSRSSRSPRSPRSPRPPRASRNPAPKLHPWPPLPPKPPGGDQRLPHPQQHLLVPCHDPLDPAEAGVGSVSSGETSRLGGFPRTKILPRRLWAACQSEARGKQSPFQTFDCIIIKNMSGAPGSQPVGHLEGGRGLPRGHQLHIRGHPCLRDA